MLTGQVYMIRHNKTGRMYIGRSSKLDNRIKHHFAMLKAGKHSVEDMQADFDKHGNDFTVSILGEADNENMNLEIEMMNKYNSTIRGVGYNYKDPHTRIKTRSIKTEYKKSIISELQQCNDIELLDLILKLLEKSRV